MTAQRWPSRGALDKPHSRSAATLALPLAACSTTDSLGLWRWLLALDPGEEVSLSKGHAPL